MINNPLSVAENVLGFMTDARRYLHRNPELSFHEYNTSEFLKKQLDNLSIVWKKCSDNGIVALIGSGEPCIAFRADMDALPIKEETGLEFCSVNDGVMHACGHDFHMAMLLGAAKVIKENESHLKGTVKLIFQPGEEKIPGGASLMIKDGVLENPKPKFVFGQHINPAENVGVVTSAAGAFMASSDELYWTVTGTAAHAAQPHLGKDPVLASAQIITTLQHIMTKYRNPLEPGVLSVTSVHGGSATNIIPDKVEMMGTLRFFNDNLRNNTLEKIRKISTEVASLYDTNCEFKPLIGYPSVNNDIDAYEIVKQSALSIENIAFKEVQPVMWAEDFAYYSKEVPSCFWFIGVKGDNPDFVTSLHHPKLSPDEKALEIGCSMFINILSKTGMI